ncbi:Dehydrogenase patE [Fusarium oxysporum f. sp. albedinis]|nr:Dehydrogenase patE [Fusarium oxysporum f. sp. albedinis]
MPLLLVNSRPFSVSRDTFASMRPVSALPQSEQSKLFQKHSEDWALAPINLPILLPSLSDLELEHKRVVLVH